MDDWKLRALLTEISILPVVSKMLDAHKKTEDGSRFSEWAHFYTIFWRNGIVRSARPRRNWRSGFCVAVAPYKGLTPLAPLARLSPFSNGRFPGTVGNSPLLVKSNIVFHTRPFSGFPGKRSFFISRLKL